MNRAVPDAAQPIVGRTPVIDNLRRLIEKASRNRLPVLLLGESGTGKEVVARAIHDANPRGQFVPIDCGSLVGTLVESDLFGHVKGSFSGAQENKKGLVEVADGGTAFFDEIGDLPLEMQVKLLRLLQERQFRAVGALQWRTVDLRIIAATHRDLRAEIAKGRFREDLYFRLNVFTIRLPPLRDRKADIPLLVDHFLERARPAERLRLARQRARVEERHRAHGGDAFRAPSRNRAAIRAGESEPVGGPGAALGRGSGGGRTHLRIRGAAEVACVHDQRKRKERHRTRPGRRPWRAR